MNDEDYLDIIFSQIEMTNENDLKHKKNIFTLKLLVLKKVKENITFLNIEINIRLYDICNLISKKLSFYC